MPLRCWTARNQARKAHVAGEVLGAREALDLPQLEDQEDGREGADSWNRLEAPHSGIVPPALDELVIQAADLLIEDPKQREAVLPNRARNCTQGQPLELSSPPHGQPACARGGLQVAPAQQGQQPIL